MLKRFALMFAATAVLAVPATSAFAAQQPSGVSPEELCFATTPWPAQPALCGQGAGSS
jgi:hypothetical protein